MRYKRDKKQIRERLNNWRKNNPDRYREYMRDYQRDKRKNNVNYLTATRLRQRIKTALKRHRGFKSASSEELVGCSFAEVVKYIESLFTEGMTWEKYFNQEIEIDHIRPCCEFNLQDPLQQKECFNYKNLRPLWKKDNRNKASEDRKKSILHPKI